MLVLVEFAGGEEATRRNEHPVQLIHHRGFAHARITGYQHELGGPLSHHPVEGCEQCIDLALSPIQLLRDQQSVRRVVSAQSEWIDPTLALPSRQAGPNIA